MHTRYSAVHETAKDDYSQAILNMWRRPVDAERIAAHRNKLETNKSIISFVAVDNSGKVLGFGELVPRNVGGHLRCRLRWAAWRG